MSEMVEQVAKALWDHSGFLWSWDKVGPRDKDKYRAMARAAIIAMKEPTDAMVGAGVEGWKINGYHSIQFVWPCMIDAALGVKA